MYVHLMKEAACVAGNSSSGIREGAFIGTPVVNIGTRQNRRLRGRNVIDVDYDTAAILDGIRSQMDAGPCESDVIYGDGNAGRRIADIIASADPAVQKTICY